MSDLKTVMERLAARFSPPDVGLEQVEGYRRRLRHRQRLFTVALAVAITAGATTAAVWSFRSYGPRFIIHPATPTGPVPPDCPSPPSPHDPYAPVLDPTSGPAGSEVSVSGVMSMLGEDRQYIPTSRIQVWWNVDPKLWYTVALPTPSPAEPGPVRLLGEADVQGQCTYQVRVAIPAADPGTYPLFLVFITPDGSSTNSSVMEFLISADPSASPPTPSGSPAISMEQAIKLARAEYTNPKAHLVRATTRTYHGRLVWVVRFDGICIPLQGPVANPAACAARTINVMLDATTGRPIIDFSP